MKKLELNYQVVGIKLDRKIEQSMWTPKCQIEIEKILDGVKVYYEKDLDEPAYLVSTKKEKIRN